MYNYWWLVLTVANLECVIADGWHNYFRRFNTLCWRVVFDCAFLINQPTHWYSIKSGTKYPQNQKDFLESKNYYCLQLIFTVSVAKKIWRHSAFTFSVNLVNLVVSTFCEFNFFLEDQHIRSSRLQMCRKNLFCKIS